MIVTDHGKTERSVWRTSNWVKQRLNVSATVNWSKLEHLVCQYHLSQSMRKATLQLHFYFCLRWYLYCRWYLCLRPLFFYFHKVKRFITFSVDKERSERVKDNIVPNNMLFWHKTNTNKVRNIVCAKNHSNFEL